LVNTAHQYLQKNPVGKNPIAQKIMNHYIQQCQEIEGIQHLYLILSVKAHISLLLENQLHVLNIFQNDFLRHLQCFCLVILPLFRHPFSILLGVQMRYGMVNLNLT
jgi:hypothetical protein